MGQFDHINQMITLSVITLSGLHCSIVHVISLFWPSSGFHSTEISLLAVIIFLGEQNKMIF
jgi:hypothetical protein